MSAIDSLFKLLTSNPPFPWQRRLYDLFAQGTIPPACAIPTGLGKTSVIAIWLIALARGAAIPRRLVYVVNRRTVVDQTTDEVESYRKLIATKTELAELKAFLDGPLAISTLRGQFADNREWSADPSRPAVICGTVDMIGSRLLFSGYGIGMKARPLHAGFLGQDALLVHDEAHLEPAFQTLIEAIEKEQAREPEVGWPKFRVMELTATRRGEGEVFGLSDADREDETVRKRVNAKKAIHLHEQKDKAKLAEQLAALALNFKDTGNAVLVFALSVENVLKVRDKLPAGQVETLTGTMRGLERDGLVENKTFARFLPKPPEDATRGTVYLVCTSAGEVGVNISADHLICDLSTFESMAQRFGRVNRFGLFDPCEIHIVYQKEWDDKHPLTEPRERTLALLRQLNGDGSPDALGRLPLEQRIEAFAPKPTILPATDILFDTWALTSITDKLPGRPKVEPYLHGISEDDYGTEFAWREEVELLTDKADIGELLDEFPFKPHETLRVPTFAKKGGAKTNLAEIAEREPKRPVWVIDPTRGVDVYPTLADLAKLVADEKVSLAERTVILPPKAGGLTTNGMLKGDEKYDAERAYDVAGTPLKGVPLRRLKLIRCDGESVFKPVAPTEGWAGDLEIALEPGEDRWKVLGKALGAPFKPALRLDIGQDEDERTDGVTEYLIVRPVAARGEVFPAEWPALGKHNQGVRAAAERIVAQLKLDKKLADAVILAAEWHDLGKGRTVWQRGAGNLSGYEPIAKTLHGRPPENLNRFRHELGSVVDVELVKFADSVELLDADGKELVSHLIATHHGRGRPHFPADESHDTERPAAAVASIAAEVPGRFARLQRRYGRWGLAYLESLLRAADILESQRIESCPLPEPNGWPKITTPPKTPTLRPFVPRAEPTPSIMVAVDPTNPGQFFACCGILELADRLWPGAQGWFGADGREFKIACAGTLPELFDALTGCRLTNTMTEAQHSRFQELTDWSVAKRKSSGVEEELKGLAKLLRESPIVLEAPFDLLLDWFTDDLAGGSRFKTWAGQQSVLAISTAMKNALGSTDWRNERCLSFSATESGLPFNFDSDLGGQGGAVDIGFSFDPLAGSALTRIESTARPALELLAFVGLQRFRPEEIRGENRFVYAAWHRPLATLVAMPAASGALPLAGATRYEFKLLYRTKYLKSFLPAVPQTGGSDE